MATVTTTTDSCHVNVVDEALTSHHDLQIPSPSESSPSTARLEDLPSTSVFSILKGSKPQLSSSMPTLTRTKARSSIKRKSRHRLFFPSRPPKACPPSSSSSAELTHVLCESLAAPDRALLIVPTGENLQTVSNLTRAPKQKESALALPHLDLRTLASGSHTQTFPSTTPSMMTTTTETHYSSSIMALYGSPKSSPNGSLADAASILAMYCPSMKSALSFSTSQPLLEPNGGPGGLVTVSSSGSDQDVSEVIVAAAVA
ncbi:hypothetical protein BGZ83_001539 [Gryganskiella cystojenkinii]|nr:hypothetical protein BGZ83_001539 [Gryganskiella cystojenkinii]